MTFNKRSYKKKMTATVENHSSYTEEYEMRKSSHREKMPQGVKLIKLKVMRKRKEM